MEMQNLNRVLQQVPSAAGTERAAETAAVRETEKTGKEATTSARSRKDRYVPGEEPVPTGTYWPETDEEGKLGIHFDSADAKPNEAKAEEEKEEKAKAAKTKETTVNTDRVDSEVEKLKEKKKQLSWQIEQTEDPEQKAQLESTMRLLNTELARMNNNGYRIAHADVSE